MDLTGWMFYFLFSAGIWARGTTASRAWERDGANRWQRCDLKKQELGRERGASTTLEGDQDRFCRGLRWTEPSGFPRLFFTTRMTCLLQRRTDYFLVHAATHAYIPWVLGDDDLVDWARGQGFAD